MNIDDESYWDQNMAQNTNKNELQIEKYFQDYFFGNEIDINRVRKDVGWITTDYIEKSFISQLQDNYYKVYICDLNRDNKNFGRFREQGLKYLDCPRIVSRYSNYIFIHV